MSAHGLHSRACRQCLSKTEKDSGASVGSHVLALVESMRLTCDVLLWTQVGGVMGGLPRVYWLVLGSHALKCSRKHVGIFISYVSHAFPVLVLKERKVEQAILLVTCALAQNTTTKCSVY